MSPSASLRPDSKETKDDSRAKFIHHRQYFSVDSNCLFLDTESGANIRQRSARRLERRQQLFIEEYKQQDFQGLYAFLRNAYLVDLKKPMVGEKSAASECVSASSPPLAAS